MAHFDKAEVGPQRFTFQVGTLSGNPVAAVAGLKTLEILRRPGSYEKLYATGQAIMQALDDNLSRVGIAAKIVGHPVLFDVVFTDRTVVKYRDVLSGNPKTLKRFNALLRERGVLKSESKFYISLAHDEDDIAKTIEAISSAIDELV